MKVLIYSFIILFTAVLFTSCEELAITDELLNDLSEGKMAVVFNEDYDETFDCTFSHFGEGNGLTGEVFINGTIPTTTEKYFTIMYGSFTNEIALTEKVYSTAATDDHITVSTSYGYLENGTAVTIKIVEITETAIKGTFKGNLTTEDGIVTIDGAFWAVKNEVN
jgi:hypothetical protein